MFAQNGTYDTHVTPTSRAKPASVMTVKFSMENKPTCGSPSRPPERGAYIYTMRCKVFEQNPVKNSCAKLLIQRLNPHPTGQKTFRAGSRALRNNFTGSRASMSPKLFFSPSLCPPTRTIRVPLSVSIPRALC